jgi:hypothetical protein
VRSRNWVAMVGVVVGLGLVPVPAAQAAFGLTVDQAAPADVKAGANSDFTLKVSFTGGDPKDLQIDLPAGLVGNVAAVPRCPLAAFEADTCDAASKVGSADAKVVAAGGLVPVDAPGDVFNLVPAGDEPARLGISLHPALVAVPLGRLAQQSEVRLRATGDGGLTSTVKDIPNTSNGMNIDLQSLQLTLAGKAGDKTFMRNPTSCGAATTKVTAVAYTGETATGTAGFTPTACDALDFSPALAATLGAKGQTGDHAHPPLSTAITQDAGEAGVRSVQVSLPAGIGPDIAKLSGACPEASLVAGSCPASSVVGTATAVAPVIAQPLTGPVRLVAPPGALPQIDVELDGPISLHLRGNIALGNRLTTTFDGIPDVPLSRFELAFTANGALQAGRDLCKTANAPIDARFTSQAGAVRTVSLAPTLDGCGPPATFAVKLGRTKGGSPSFKLTADGAGHKLRTITVKLPSGLTVRREERGTDKRSSATVRLTRTQLRATLPKAGTPKFTLRLNGALAAGKRLRSKKHPKHVTFDVSATFTDGSQADRTVKVAVKR